MGWRTAADSKNHCDTLIRHIRESIQFNVLNMPEEDGSRLASNKRKLRTLLFSSLYPSSIRPGHGIFVETRLRELLSSSQVETRVVSPVPWFFSTNQIGRAHV